MLFRVGNDIINIDHVVYFRKRIYNKKFTVTVNVAAGPDEGSDTTVYASGKEAEKLWNWLLKEVVKEFEQD